MFIQEIYIKLDRHLVLHFWIICLNKKYTLLAGPNKLNKNQLKNIFVRQYL